MSDSWKARTATPTIYIVEHGKVVTHSGQLSHTTEVHTNSRHGSGHKQWTDYSSTH